MHTDSRPPESLAITQERFERILSNAQRKNPELIRADNIDDYFAAFDIKGSSVSLGVFSKSFGEDEILGLSADIPVRTDEADETIKELEKEGYGLFDRHPHIQEGEEHLHVSELTTPSGLPSAIGKALQVFQRRSIP